MPTSGGYILDNYVLAKETFGRTVEEWGSIGRASIRGRAGQTRGKRRGLLARLDDLLTAFEGLPPHQL
jgi:hypothetical protein